MSLAVSTGSDRPQSLGLLAGGLGESAIGFATRVGRTSPGVRASRVEEGRGGRTTGASVDPRDGGTCRRQRAFVRGEQR